MNKVIFCALFLGACGSTVPIPKDNLNPRQEKIKELIRPNLQAFFKQDLEQVFKTPVHNEDAAQVKTDCLNNTAYACYFEERYILIYEMPDYEYCFHMAHEFVHAIGHQVYGDPDHDHKKYPFDFISESACAILHFF